MLQLYKGREDFRLADVTAVYCAMFTDRFCVQLSGLMRGVLVPLSPFDGYVGRSVLLNGKFAEILLVS